MDYKDYIQEKKVDISKSDPSFELGLLIAEARLHSRLSQDALAKRMGTTQSSIARAEGGEVQPSIEFLERVAKAIGTYLVYPKFGFMLEREKSTAANTFAAIQDNMLYLGSRINHASTTASLSKGGTGYFYPNSSPTKYLMANSK